MNDLEDRLRADLFSATAQLGQDADVEAVLESAHRARRGRTIRRTAGLAAFALVLGSLGWATLGSGGLGSSAPVLATPSPPASPSVAPGATDSVEFSGYLVPSHSNAKSVTVNATLLADGQYAVEFTMISTAQETKRERVTTVGRSIAWAQLGPRLLVGFVPHRLDWIHYLDRDEAGPFGAFSSDEKAFNTLDATAVYRVAAKEGDYAGLRDYLWRGADGSYHYGDGDLVPNVAVGDKTFYLARDLGEAGELGMVEDDGSSSTKIASDAPTFLRSWTHSKTFVSTAAALLPVGASDPDPKVGVEQAAVQVVELGGRVLVVATATVPDDLTSAFTAVTYTDANGNRVTRNTQKP